MVLEVTCGKCGSILYTGFELKSPKDILRQTGAKCKFCNSPLSSSDFEVQVKKI